MYVRIRKGSLAFTAPHAEHVLELGNHRPATSSRPPFQALLYFSWRRISPNPASATRRASLRFLIIPATLRSSTTTVPYWAARLVVSLCMASRRRFAVR